MKAWAGFCRGVWMAGLLLAAPSTALAATGETFGPYPAKVLRVVDGDTIELEVALWPGLSQRIRLRLDGVNTPEKQGKGVTPCEKAAAQKASEFTRQFLARASTVVVTGVRLGKYAGRALGRIAALGKDLGAALITAGLARPYAGGRRKAWCG